MIDPSNIPPNLRAAIDRKPALVPPVSAGAFLRATKANPLDARNAVENATDGELVEKCLEIIRTEGRASVALFQRRLQLGYIRSAGLMDLLERDGFVGKGEIGFDRPILIETPAQKPEFRSQATSSCPPETKSVESSMVTRFKCAVCGRLTVGRIPKGGNGTFRYPAKHFIGETLCRGVHDEAEWVDVLLKSPRSCDPLPVSCPPEPVRVAREQGKPKSVLKPSHENRNKSPCAEPESSIFHEPLATNEGEKGHPSRVSLIVVSYRRRLIDTDNLCAKFFVDACRYAGFIKDDRAEDIEFSIRQEKVASKELERTEITITTP